MTTDQKPLHERLREEAIKAADESVLAASRGEPPNAARCIDAIHALASALEEQAARPDPMAYIEHHKGGDNLVWDNPGGKYTPLYAATRRAIVRAAAALARKDAA